MTAQANMAGTSRGGCVKVKGTTQRDLHAEARKQPVPLSEEWECADVENGVL